MIDLSTVDAALSAIEILQRAGNAQPQLERARRALNLERARLVQLNRMRSAETELGTHMLAQRQAG